MNSHLFCSLSFCFVRQHKYIYKRNMIGSDEQCGRSIHSKWNGQSSAKIIHAFNLWKCDRRQKLNQETAKLFELKWLTCWNSKYGNLQMMDNFFLFITFGLYRNPHRIRYVMTSSMTSFTTHLSRPRRALSLSLKIANCHTNGFIKQRHFNAFQSSKRVESFIHTKEKKKKKKMCFDLHCIAEIQND